MNGAVEHAGTGGALLTLPELRKLSAVKHAHLHLVRANSRESAVVVLSPPFVDASESNTPRDLLARSILTADELARWRAFPADIRRDSYLQGRWAAKLALLKLTGTSELREFAIDTGVFGQPVARNLPHMLSSVSDNRKLDGFAGPWHISLSHCPKASVAMAGPAGHPFGVDVEQLSSVAQLDPQTHVNEGEWTICGSIDAPVREKVAVLWTAKEALSKVLQCGFTIPLHLLQISDMHSSETGRYVAHFSNFLQYRCLTYVLSELIISLVVPARTDVEGLAAFCESCHHNLL